MFCDWFVVGFLFGWLMVDWFVVGLLGGSCYCVILDCLVGGGWYGFLVRFLVGLAGIVCWCMFYLVLGG